MSIQVALHHKTEYTYDKAISIYPHIVRLRPALHTRTPILSYSLKVEPKEHFLNWQQDPFGNYQARFVFLEKASHLSIEVDLLAEMTVINPFDFFLESYAEEAPFSYDDSLLDELQPYLQIKDSSDLLKEYVSQISLKKQRTVDFLVEINQKIYKDISYIIRMESGVQTPMETLKLGRGSCRDSAWLFVQTLRHLGIAARFSSGYLIQLVPDQKPLEGPQGPEVDFTDLHAWTEVFLPGAGWVGLDPTSGLFAGEGHIPLACTPDPSNAAPVTGATEKSKVSFNFEMNVTRIDEKSRTTKPYTEDQWNKIYALGLSVDTKLKLQDVRLTMGGEPTFVSSEDMDGSEWNIDALGPTKKRYAHSLLYNLKNKFSNGGLLHYGQGKWYPGESLPRWAITCYWRKDGTSVWKDESLLSDEYKLNKYSEKHSYLLIKRIASYLGITDKYLLPGYEDIYYYLWKEGNLPLNDDPYRVNLKESEERKNLRKVFERGLEKVVGFGIPLRWNPIKKDWETGFRAFKRERMYLIPGDSPMGYRLPLMSLPISDKYSFIEEPSTFEGKKPLPNYYEIVSQRYKRYSGKDKFALAAEEAEWEKIQKLGYPNANNGGGIVFDDVVRTTLCVEPRDGNLFVFIPPLVRLEEYLDLISSIELAAQELKYSIIVEGYPPAYDERLEKFSITPDPGVIEVNIHPTQSWEQLIKNTEMLYHEARKSKLIAEKFMLDGRHTGTGGGNHITLGGISPSDSPILRRPDLLRSLLTYWQNHPGLSYLFSGIFVGPTSQAPRIDEARHEALNELEIAFRQIDNKSNTPSWMIDRLLRNLLTDITGNTHRAEFCIDKLYSPDSSSGRLGLLELRAFEMPPHERMSITQMLLIRSIISNFWENPYKRNLVRFGTELHDKYMLPHFIWEDFCDVIEDLNRNGYSLDKEWYEVFLNFRFPLAGKMDFNGITLELRNAAEPWLVLGEEGAVGGTSRFVDSSLERLQVRVFGMNSERYILTCNQKVVPLKSTGTNNEFVAGIRFKAWHPPSSLHPNIKSHSPLVFDIIDTWKGRSIGGCTYHVAHPGGRNYTTFPVNANEAESRRISRFFQFGHTPGNLNFEGKEIVNPEFPYTLDLRKQ